MMRKLSISRKSSANDVASLDGVRKDKPPKSRSASETPGTPGSANGDETPEKVAKRKPSLGSKSKKRLSSLFSSNSLSSLASEDRKSPRRSFLSSSTSTSGTTTPSRGGSRGYSGLDSKGVPPEAVTAGIQSLRLGTDTVAITESPQPSPTAITANGNGHGTDLGTSRPPRIQVADQSNRHSRTPSLYSQWEEEDVESDEDEDEDFLSASEGLSEVEEGDEEAAENEEKAAAAQSVPPPAYSSTSNGDAAKKTHVQLHRSKAVVETKVQQRSFSQRGNPADVDQAGVLAVDLDVCRQVLQLFLTSHMKESEELIEVKDPDNTHLYLQSAHGIIQSLKGLMTFDAHDLTAALDICKGTSATATALRKPGESIVTKLGGLVRSGHGVARIKTMTPLERHAELVYAETSLMKAILAIVSGGDWMGMIKEALNMRTAHGIYRNLQMFLEDADKHGYDDSIDMDFRSGVLLGTGTSSLMLSLLPGKVLKIAEVFGYAGDRKVALDTLMSAGGWEIGSTAPAFDESNEGIRRPVCDMILLAFHLVISVLMPVAGVDINVARAILGYNMRRYPDGVFFLYFQARLHTTECEPELANKCLQRALDLKLEYVQLQHMCLWDYGCNYLMLCNWEGARQCYEILKEESNWSRATYTFVTAACTMAAIDEGSEPDPVAAKAEVDKLIKAVPKLTKKIAGKSLPIEKYVARKARKFASQNDHLFLPALELSYVFGSLSHTPRRALLEEALPRIDKALAELEASTPEKYGNGMQYWDDYCLGHFLRGVVLCTARYQPPEASEAAKQRNKGEMSDAEMDKASEADFLASLKHGVDVQLDHYIVYHCHYELGRLYACRGDKANAKIHFDVVMSGKLLEVNPHQQKAHGKYSLEGALQLKAHAALQALKEA